jgi:thioredoxin 1
VAWKEPSCRRAHRFPLSGIYDGVGLTDGEECGQPELQPNPEEMSDMAGQFVSEVNDAEFEAKVLQSDTPVLVDFWAAWCGPCRALAPVVDAVAEQYDGKLKVMKMDVDKNNMTPGRYGIRGIPALLIFKGGKVAEQIVGFVPKDTIDDTLKRVLV